MTDTLHADQVPMTEPLFIFRVLTQKEPDYGNVFIARCLEAGCVTIADDPDTAEDMMKELLTDEVLFAITNNNLPNLYSSPAPLQSWLSYAALRATSDLMASTIRLNNRDDIDIRLTFLRHS